ncbi:MAG: choice-of-anchor D domain-containing protein, partial [Candidatus Zixiibacteriota bacterium]
MIITNIGTDVLNVGAVAMSNADFSVDVSSFSLTPGQSQVATVTFTPSSPGVINGTMTISSDDPDQPSLEVLLSGVGLIPPVIGVSPASLSDSLLTGDSSLHTLTISNTGGSDLVFDVSFKNSAGPALMPVPPEDFFDQNTAILSGALAPLPSTEDSPQIVTPSAGSPDSSILVIQDFSSWGVFMSSFIQSTFGLTPTVINSTQITSTDFSPFDLVITTGSQSTSYYTRISSSVGKFEDFVAAGGVVQYQAATQGPDVLIVDSARVINSNREDFNRVLLPTHPIVAGLPTILEGNFANHGILADLPVAASVITETSNGNSPTTVEYGFGLGTVVATGMTWEFLFDRGFNSGPMLVNALAYSLSLAGVGWVSVEPSAGVTVPAGGSIDLSVTFNATGLFGGAYTADISIVSNDSLSPEVLVPALLHVTGAPDLQTSDTSLDFGTVFIGVTRTDSFVVSNIGVEVLNVSGISSSSTDYTATPGLFSLAPGGTRLVEVSFAPTVEGAIPAALTISSDDPLEPTVIVALAGSGLLPPIISAAPDSLDADQLTDDITTQILTVSNGGSSDLIFDAVVLSAPGSPPAPYLLTPPDSSGDAPDYDGTAPDPLAPPYRTTPISATLFDLSGVVILSNGSLGSWTTIVSDLTLRGAVVHEFFGTLTPALLDTVDIYWTHDFSGWSPSELTALSGWVNAGGSVLFEADQSSSAYNQLLAAIGVNITFASGGSSGTTSNIFPHETTLGVASLALNSNLGHLSNVSAPAGLLVSDVSGQPHGAYSAAGFGRVIALANEDFVNSSIGIVDNQLFANQVFDWLAQALGWLSVSPESDTIPAGLSTDLTVTFDATGLFGGDYNARIALNSNDPFTPQLSVPAHMFVTGIPKIDVTPVSFDFGPLFIGLSLTDQFVVTNTGTDLLTVSSIVSDNTEFAADASSFTLNPTEDTVIGVTYTPTTAGIVNASLTITSDAANLPVALVTMTAEGVIPPDISVVPASISDTLISNSTSTHLLNIFHDGGSDLI